ncbi:pentatricopeptide repeat-containing protein At5g39710-like [Dioscorea cayenensis subsp. rotundata]|uniref:Pentatricopeptide repeat-containing protein At5g39710-like n=1 Tax=Dioscorea cayennensis subsp. rotundata TaxID=55577 RepID=A0AB40B8M0_DIOCR|nr:pentatricopeptide repeat-containing protein At5g39710-like [Dioscorea cayenensis subsp. rotundata]
MFSAVIQGYANASRMDDSIGLYDNARNQGLVPSVSCFKALLNALIRNKNAEFAVRVYMDMIDVGHGLSSEEHILDFVVRELAKRGEMLSAVNMLRRVKMFGIKASLAVLSEIAEGYCKKKDYEDMLKFMKEWEVIPKTHSCNKITSALCRNLASEEAWSYVQKMEVLGFDPDAVTFGILIVQMGFLRRGWVSMQKVIYEDMIEKDLKARFSNFSGFCWQATVCVDNLMKLKRLLSKMVDCGMISLAFTEDALSKAFMLLGLDHLETDLDEYERILDDILNNEIIPKLDSHLLKYCLEGDIGSALRVMNKVVQWGHAVSLSTFFTLLKGLCESLNHIKELMVDEMLKKEMLVESSTYTALIMGFCKEDNVGGLKECLEVAKVVA